mgnify:CR=1 FL=1
MCKNLNIGIVLFLIIGLVMSGCIRKLNLYQGDKDEDENKDNGKRRMSSAKRNSYTRSVMKQPIKK